MMRHSGFLWLHVTVLFDLVLAQLFEIAENKNRTHTHRPVWLCCVDVWAHAYGIMAFQVP